MRSVKVKGERPPPTRFVSLGLPLGDAAERIKSLFCSLSRGFPPEIKKGQFSPPKKNSGTLVKDAVHRTTTKRGDVQKKAAEANTPFWVALVEWGS